MKWVIGLVIVAIVVVLIRRRSHSQPSFEYPYVSLKPENIADVPDHELEERVLDHVYWQIGSEFENVRKTVLTLPKPVQYVYATWWVEAEVGNGGFNQYFVNSAGQLFDIASEGYGVLGLPEHKALLDEAIELEHKLSGEGGRNYETIEEFSASYEDNPLNGLDSRFYELEEPGDARVRYIREHAAELERVE